MQYLMESHLHVMNDSHTSNTSVQQSVFKVDDLERDLDRLGLSFLDKFSNNTFMSFSC